MPESMKNTPAKNKGSHTLVTQTAIKVPLYRHALLCLHPSDTTLPTQHSGRNDGFTLIEVLIAMVVLSIGIISYLGMQGASISGNANARRLTESSTWASDRIELLLSESYTSIVTGTDTRGNLAMTWTVTNDSPIINTKSIAVTVNNTSTTPPKTVTLNFIKSKTF